MSCYRGDFVGVVCNFRRSSRVPIRSLNDEPQIHSRFDHKSAGIRSKKNEEKAGKISEINRLCAFEEQHVKLLLRKIVVKYKLWKTHDHRARSQKTIATSHDYTLQIRSPKRMC